MKKVKSETLHQLADFFKILGDFTRLRIIHALSDKELSVSQITSAIQMEQSAVSHQLRLLKQSRLVKQRRDGKMIYYSLDDNHILDIFNQGITHINEK